MNGSNLYLHEDFTNDDVIIILEDSAEYDSDAVLHCVNIPVTRMPTSFPVHVYIAAILFFLKMSVFNCAVLALICQ